MKMRTPDKQNGEQAKFVEQDATVPDTLSPLHHVSIENTSQLESVSDPSAKQLLECISPMSLAGSQILTGAEKYNLKLDESSKGSSSEQTKAVDGKQVSSNLYDMCDNEPDDIDVPREDLLRMVSRADRHCSMKESEEIRRELVNIQDESALISSSEMIGTSNKGPTNPSIILSSSDTEPTVNKKPKKFPEPLFLNIDTSSGTGMHSRKSPVTVQEWVDSIPLSPHLEEDPELVDSETDPSLSLAKPQGISNMCPSVTLRPASSQGGTAADQRREAFSRDVSPSLQSDTGSHGSSVDSYLDARRPDPEEVLLDLGFGGPLHNTEAEVSRIPSRFLQPSKVKGVAIDDFLRYQQDLIETFESGYSGYRGLTGGAQIPSVIVAKIMEKLREHERDSSIKSSAGSSPGHHADISKRRFSRAAQRITILTKMKSRDSIVSGPPAHSVLNPDNRKFLDNQGNKSPEVLRKRMIIGQRSFTFDGDGQLIETDTNSEDASAPETTVPSKPPLPRPLIHNDSNISSATSLSLTSYDSDSDTDERSGGGEMNIGDTSGGARHAGMHTATVTSAPTEIAHLPSNRIDLKGDENNLGLRRLSLPFTSDLSFKNLSSLNMLDQTGCGLDRNVVSNNKTEAEMIPSSTPEMGRSWRDLQRVNSAPSISPVGVATVCSVLQTHNEENSLNEERLLINGRKSHRFNTSERLLDVFHGPKKIDLTGSCKVPPITAKEIPNYKITDFTLPYDGYGPISPESQSSLSADSQNLQRQFSMPKSSSMFLDRELRRKLSLNSSVDSYVARSVANTPDLRNWSTSSVSSWESEKEIFMKDSDNVEELCVFEDRSSLSTSALSKSDLNSATKNRRGSLKRQDKVDEEEPAEGNTQSNFRLDVSNLASDKGDSFEMEELVIEEEGLRFGSAHSDSSGFQEESNHNKEIPHRATLGKQLSESEPMLSTQIFPDENTFPNSLEHLKRLSLPVIRVQDESGLTQWRANNIYGGNFSFSNPMRRVQSLPTQICRLGVGRFSENFSPGSLSDSIGNMFSSCSDESVIHVPSKSMDVTCGIEQRDLLLLPTAIEECCKCHCALSKSLTKCQKDLSLSQENSESFLSISQSLDTLKEAHNRIKDVMLQVQDHLCCSTECSMNTALEQVSLVIQHQNYLCEQLGLSNFNLLSNLNNTTGQTVSSTSHLDENVQQEAIPEDSPSPKFQLSSEKCTHLCQVVERENRKLQDLVRINVNELTQVRKLLERLLPDVKT